MDFPGKQQQGLTCPGFLKYWQMDTFRFITICPDCGQRHTAATQFQGKGGLKDSGVGVCDQCGSIFAIVREGEQINTYHLNADQLSKMAQMQPRMFSKLLLASIELKKYRFRNQKN
jgi:hypothetical protein